MVKINLFLSLILLICSCTATTPKKTNNICDIFREKDNWYSEIKESSEKWGLPIHVSMAIIHQESGFIADAEPPRPYLLGFIPWFRSSSAYGYAQAQDGTWEDFVNNSSSPWRADRDDFSDACDFIGWYCTISHHKLGISKWDTQKLYLAYHEGHGGYRRKTYIKKPWLIKVAKKVDNKSRQYRTQLSQCKDEFENTDSFFW